MADEVSGWPSRELGTDPIVRRPGSHQFLRGRSHPDDGTKIWTEHSNTVQPGMIPREQSSRIGTPTAAKPGGYPDRSIEE